MITNIIRCMFIDLDQIFSTATFLCDPDLAYSCARSLNIFTVYLGKPLHLGLFYVDLLKFCCPFCDLDFVHSNFKFIQYLRLTIAFKLVLSQFFSNFVAALQSGHTVF